MLKTFKKKTISLTAFLITLIIIFFFVFSKNFINSYKKNTTLIKDDEIEKKINSQKSENSNQKEVFYLKKNNLKDTLRGMVLAKKYILNNNLEKSFEILKNCLKNTEEENLKNILKIKMTKIKIQKNEYKIAIKILESIKNKNWINIVENIKGDIFSKQNKKKQAINCWKKSLLQTSSNASKEIIKMKINELM
ncbi:hypothetical protein ATN01_03030 [Buchnera aphidicola (Diuraphis noxia)]|uniref:Ancillary SecYEG translocon subunit n=1 Tax=Buchnera aphidicola subsp. Diuraphis noxia TaxID=118101 RepID=A0A1B2H9C0_BUCDN|nr:tetratricopeptide repeat protein [Buchnera aphidicola]ANZ22777.1 hypothetical protein ATN01_03030 [Buchnera aphidicola (Diuraphis noxia)]